MATPSSAAGTQLAVSAASPISYANVTYVEGIEMSGQARNEIDVTPISATAEEFIGDVPSFGQMSFTLFWDPSDTQHALIMGNLVDSVNLAWRVTMDDAGACQYTFSGFVKEFNRRHQKGRANEAGVVVRITGTITTTP